MKKTTLEKLKAKQVKMVSIRTKSKEGALVENCYSYSDKLVIGNGMADYSKKSTQLENDGNTIDVSLGWHYETTREILDERIAKVFKAVKDFLTSDKKPNNIYCDCNEGIYFTVYFDDDTTYNAAFYVPGSEISGVVEAIIDLVPSTLETPMICDL